MSVYDSTSSIPRVMVIKSTTIDGNLLSHLMEMCTLLISNSWDPIVKYIKDQHSAYLRKELTAQRERYIQDTRIHCCLFFIQPSGHAYVAPLETIRWQKEANRL